MSFERIIGQPLAVKLVQRWLEKQTNQPLLFYGPEGVGKRLLARTVAQALNCAESPGVSACSRCLSCGKIESGKHPDVRVIDLAYQAIIRGEPVEKQQALRIETVLEERKRLYQTAHEASWKVSIVEEAHRFTPDAANVLLKILEEPPPRTAIFLLTPYRDRLFSTLLSRCQPVRFRALPEKPSETAPARLPLERPSRATRQDIEDELQRLLKPAVQEFRSGRFHVAAKVELIQRAQQQLRQNVPPSLVYDHLLLQLASLAAPR